MDTIVVRARQAVLGLHVGEVAVRKRTAQVEGLLRRGALEQVDAPQAQDPEAAAGQSIDDESDGDEST